jgi:hypothetical protein
MGHTRPAPRRGGPPLTDQRNPYIKLMSQGMSIREACKVVGIDRRAGQRWSNGRTVVTLAGRVLPYNPIPRPPVVISDRSLSEDERLSISGGLQSGLSLRAIAASLGRDPGTVSREVSWNSDPASGRGHPYRAHCGAAARRARPKPGKLVALASKVPGFGSTTRTASEELNRGALRISSRPARHSRGARARDRRLPPRRPVCWTEAANQYRPLRRHVSAGLWAPGARAPMEPFPYRQAVAAPFRLGSAVEVYD